MVPVTPFNEVRLVIIPLQQLIEVKRDVEIVNLVYFDVSFRLCQKQRAYLGVNFFFFCCLNPCHMMLRSILAFIFICL